MHRSLVPTAWLSAWFMQSVDPFVRIRAIAETMDSVARKVSANGRRVSVQPKHRILVTTRTMNWFHVRWMSLHAMVMARITVVREIVVSMKRPVMRKMVKLVTHWWMSKGLVHTA